jgi:predicted 3-demethylubiquinone-9 3-methyltransferase (glyoxalase superfamily)
VNPREMGKYIGGPDPEGAARAMAAMMKMDKLVVAELRAAYEGE